MERNPAARELRLWCTTWRMTGDDTRERYRDAAEKVEGSLQIRTPFGLPGDFLKAH